MNTGNYRLFEAAALDSPEPYGGAGPLLQDQGLLDRLPAAQLYVNLTCQAQLIDPMQCRKCPFSAQFAPGLGESAVGAS